MMLHFLLIILLVFDVKCQLFTEYDFFSSCDTDDGETKWLYKGTTTIITQGRTPKDGCVIILENPYVVGGKSSEYAEIEVDRFIADDSTRIIFGTNRYKFNDDVGTVNKFTVIPWYAATNKEFLIIKLEGSGLDEVGIRINFQEESETATWVVPVAITCSVFACVIFCGLLFFFVARYRRNRDAVVVRGGGAGNPPAAVTTQYAGVPQTQPTPVAAGAYPMAGAGPPPTGYGSAPPPGSYPAQSAPGPYPGYPPQQIPTAPYGGQGPPPQQAPHPEKGPNY